MRRELVHETSERAFRRTAAETTHVILRIGVALLFMQHGGQKLFGWFGGVNGEGATVALVSQMGLAGVLEMFGGLLLLVGVLTRPLAVLLVIEMGAAYLIAHAPQGGLPMQNQGELALLYGLAFLFFAGNGAGRLSVDSWLTGRGERSIPPAQTGAERVRSPRKGGRAA